MTGLTKKVINMVMRRAIRVFNPCENTMSQAISPCSVTLKISKTSVMLYAVRYIKRAGEAGATMQEYLGSFPISSTEIPVTFDALLRQATVGRPDRYAALLEKIDERVLGPARLQATAAAQKKAWEMLSEHLDLAASQLQQAKALPYFEQYVQHPAMQVAVSAIVEQASSAIRAHPKAVEGTRQTKELHLLATHDASGKVPAEHRLQMLLAQLGQTCDEIAALMPDAARHFRRGHKFEPATTELVKKAWFKTSDAIAALGGRSQLRRPKRWEHLRTDLALEKWGS